MTEDQHVVVDHRIGRRVDAPDGECPIAAEDGALERDVLAEVPAEHVEQPPPHNGGRTLAQERVALVGGQHDLGIHVEIRRRVDGEGREEALAVAVAPAEPIGPTHRLHPRQRPQAAGVGERQREDNARGVGGYQSAGAAELCTGGDGRHHGAERRE